MVGRDRASDYYHIHQQREVDGQETILSVQKLSGVGFSDISFDLRAGEMVGIGGLLDSGKSALGKAVAGVHPPRSGTVTLAGLRPAPQHP